MINEDVIIFDENGSKTVHSEQSCMDSLAYWLKSKNERIEELTKEVKELRENYDKDAEVAELKKRLEEVEEDNLRGFPITKTQSEAIRDWCKKHIAEEHNGDFSMGAIGGGFIYQFIPTSLGIVGSIHCACGKSFDFEEIE